MLQYFLEKIRTGGTSLPALIDEESALECIRTFSGQHITDISECRTGNIANIFVYEKSDEKKHLSITDMRRFIEEISIQPYTARALYILSDFDEATHEAMNASLKILEEPPAYAIILLIVKNPESVLETIHSRTITLFRSRESFPISEELRSMIREYYTDKTDTLISWLYKEKLELSEAIAILKEATYHAPQKDIDLIEQSIIHLFQVNENPRNILDRVFVCKI